MEGILQDMMLLINASENCQQLKNHHKIINIHFRVAYPNFQSPLK